MTRLRLAVALIACVFSLWAATPGSSAAQDAPSLIERGVELRREGRHLEALELFERAVALDASARALGQVALAQHALGRYVEAARGLRAVLRLNDSWAESRESTLRAALSDCEANLGTVIVSGCAEGDDVRVDGRSFGDVASQSEIEVRVGIVDVECVRAGAVVGAARTAVRARTLSRVEVTAEAPRAVAPPQALSMTDEASSSGVSWMRTTGVTAAIVGGIGVGVAVVLHGLSESAASDFRDSPERCPERYSGRAPACDQLYRRTHDLRDAALVTYALGGAAVVAGVVLWLLAPSSSSEDLSTNVLCVPSATGAMIGVSCGGTF